MGTHSSHGPLRHPSLPSLFRFLAEWARPHAPVVRPRIRPTLEMLEARTIPAMLHVTSLADDGTAGTLRSIIATANTNADTSNTIVFDLTGTIDLVRAPLNPPTGIFPGPTAFDVNKPLTIIGSGQTITRNQDASFFRLFFVEATGNLSLSNLTLSNGLARGFNGAIGGGGGAAGLGGAIYNRGTLNVQSVTFTGNAAVGGNGAIGGLNGTAGQTPGGGGGLGSAGYGGGAGGGPNGGNGNFNGGSGIGYGGGFGGGGSGTGYGGGGGGGGGGFGGGGAGTGKSFSFGGAGGFGGGGGGSGSGSLSGRGGSSVFGGGTGGIPGADTSGRGTGSFGGGGGGGGAFGGAIFSEMGTATITNSTLFGNSVTGGAGGANAGAERTSNPGGNGSGYGGAVFVLDTTLTITNSTLSGNTVAPGSSAGPNGAAAGRDVFITTLSAPTSAVINNSILGQADKSFSDFDSAQFAEITPATSSGANNLIRTPGTFGGSSSQADPIFDPAGPQDNGGLTKTIALLASSPAIGAGSNTAPGAPATDQRGLARPDVAGTNVDVGAFEVQQVQPPPPPPPSTATITSLNVGSPPFEFAPFTLVINGTNFDPNAAVVVGNATVTNVSVTATQITATVLALDEGPFAVAVINPNQTPVNGGNVAVQEEFIAGETRDANHLFFSEVLRDLMRHAPNLSDINFYTGLLTQGLTRTQVIHAIEFEPVHHEFLNLEITDVYHQLLGSNRPVDSLAYSSWLPFLTDFKGTQLHTLEQMAALLVGSPEFQRNNSSDYLDAFIHDVLGRSATDADRQQAQGRTPLQEATAVGAGDEFRTLLLNIYYQQYLDHGYTPSASNPLSKAFPVGMGSEDEIAGILGEPKAHEFFNKTAS